MVDSVISMKNVTKFVDRKPIVYRVNLEIPKGTLYGLLGPNGAGKSTIIKLLTGRIKPTSGTIRVNGFDPWKERVEVNRSLGYLAQNTIQYDEKTTGDFMTFMGRLKGFPKMEAKIKGQDILDQVGMGRFENTPIGKLSGGERQRLGFANSLIGDPDILILDEPTASLDPAGRVYFMQLIEKLAKDEEKTIIISSHILPEIRRMTNYVAILAEGSVLTSGNINVLTQNIFDTEYEIRTNKPQALQSILQQHGYQSLVENDRIYLNVEKELSKFWKEIPQLCQSNGIELRSLVPMRDSLEKLFLQLVQRKQEETDDKSVQIIENKEDILT